MNLELREKVAIRMGWTGLNRKQPANESVPSLWGKHPTDHVTYDQRVPEYERDAGAAWQLVEALRDKFDIEVHSHHGWASSAGSPWKDLGPIWTAQIRKSMPPDRRIERWFSGDGETVAEAICEIVLRSEHI